MRERESGGKKPIQFPLIIKNAECEEGRLEKKKKSGKRKKSNDISMVENCVKALRGKREASMKRKERP